MTFDIIRRILRDYFNYDITYVMNITDIDDKIILRARQSHLVREFAAKHLEITPALKEELATAWNAFVQSKLGFSESLGEWTAFASILSAEFAAKAGNLSESEAKKSSALEIAKRCREHLDGQLPTGNEWLVEGCFADVLASWLDSQFGSSVTDQRIFRELAAFWERDFLEDMQSLNVLPADYMTRVSEYVPEIISYVEKIIQNGFAYATEGSVYFDVAAFERDSTHSYAKLCPWSAGNSKFFEEGEGALGVKLVGKRDPRDFALWKCSKPGEPFWPSPWGKGRPGWHIECSAMASSVLPATLDIHSGGIDLAFPHHDNEIAQAEAHFHSHQWVNYFLHAGHVHIEGLKMSKSLKNFISIKEALKRYSARQLRFLFLQHTWSSTLIYKESSMQAAAAVDATFTNFFANVPAIIREQRKKTVEHDESADGLLPNDHGNEERELLKALDRTRTSVHSALCDSFDTPAALSALIDLIGKTNVYLKQNSSAPSTQTLIHILRYVDRMYRMFGLGSADEVDATLNGSGGASAASSQAGSIDVLAILENVAAFRDAVRNAALKEKSSELGKSLLTACDHLRKGLSGFGVVFEDRSSDSGSGSLVKLVDPAELAREVSAQAAREAEAEARRLEMLRLNEEKAAAKAKKAAINPGEMFKGVEGYSTCDEKGIPTHDSAGAELSKNARKKLVKEFEAQVELFAKHHSK
jgi:cysteinyl-tRNA synthetase